MNLMSYNILILGIALLLCVMVYQFNKKRIIDFDFNTKGEYYTTQIFSIVFLFWYLVLSPSFEASSIYLAATIIALGVSLPLSINYLTKRKYGIVTTVWLTLFLSIFIIGKLFGFY